MKRYIEFILRFRILVILMTVVISVLLVSQIKALRIIFDPNTMLPQSHPYVAATNKVEEIFGAKYIVVVGITPKNGDIFQPDILAKIQRITAGLMRAPNVVKANTLSISARKAKSIDGIDGGLVVKPLLLGEQATPEQIKTLKKALETNPVYQNSIVSGDGRTAAVVVEFKRNTKGFSEIVDNIMPIIDRERNASVDIAVGGVPIYVSNLEKYSQRMLYLFPLAVFIIGLIHFDAFRTIQGLLLPLVTALFAVIWGVGIMAMLNVPMDAFNSTTPILILAVAAGHAVQLLKRYYEIYHEIRDTTALSPKDANYQAVIQSLTRIAPVMLTAGIVAALGFFSLTVFDIVTIKTFGVFTGIGIVSAVILEMTFTPALRSLLPPPKYIARRQQQKSRIWSKIISGIISLVTTRKRRWLYAATLSLLAVSLAGISHIKIDNSTKTYFSKGLNFQKDDAFLNSRLAGTNTLYLLVEGNQPDAVKNPRILRAMDAVQHYLAAQPYIGKTVSLVDFVKRMNQAMHGDDAKYYRIPDEADLIAQYLLLYSMSGEPGDFDLYVDQNYQTANVVAYLKTDSSAYLEQLVPALKAFIDKNFDSSVRIEIGGSIAQAAALNETMVHSKILNIVQIATVVFIISSLMLRSIVAGLLVLLPLLVAVVVNFGLMGLTGILLNIPTSLTSAMVVGIGADYAIYMIYRLRETLRDRTSLVEAAGHTLDTAGSACLFVALAIAGGYSVLLLSFGFLIHAWMAILIVVAMTVSVFAAITLIPALIITFKPRFVFTSEGATPAIRVTAAILFAAMSAFLAAPGKVYAQDNTAREIMEKNYAVTRVEDSVAHATFILINSNKQERVRKTLGMTKLQKNGIDNMRMTRFLSPPDIRGTVTLLNEHTNADDDIWIYLPALKKVRRLVSSAKKDSFVGTDFSYGDIIGHRVADWNHKLLGEETLDGQPCFQVESTPINASVKANSGYSKRVTWIRKDNFSSVKAQFWDENGELLKITTVKDIRQVDEKNGKWQGMRLETANLQTDHKTVIQFDDFKANQKIKDDYFTTRYMERAE